MENSKSIKAPLITVCLLAVLAGGIGLGLYLGKGNNENRSQSGKTSEEIERIKSIPKPAAPLVREESENGNASKELPPINALEGLNDPEGDIHTDILILDHLFREARTMFHRLPTGTHDEIVSFLQGTNSKSLAYFSNENPNLNENGKVIDRWGTPYFFHVQSSDQIEVRSAGPDKLHWSEDDIVSDTAPDAIARF